MIESALKFLGFHSRAYRAVFNQNSPAAQYVLADLLERGFMTSTTMRSNDPIELARNEGKRQMALVIVRALNLTPEQQYALIEQKARMTHEQ